MLTSAIRPAVKPSVATTCRIAQPNGNITPGGVMLTGAGLPILSGDGQHMLR